MKEEQGRYEMQAGRRRRPAILGILVLGFGAAALIGACQPSKPGPISPDVIPRTQPPECAKPKPCPLYRIPLLGNPKDDLTLRNKYIAAFGSACYMSEVDTF